MATSQIPAALDRLVSIFTSAATIGAATPKIAVYDGPKLTQADDQQVLWVGLSDPDADTADTAAESTQSFPGIGSRQRDELAIIYCVAESWSGDSNVGISPMRVQAYGIVAAVENIVRADATLGGLFPSAGWAEVDGLQLRQNQTDIGAVARVAFHIKYKARI